MPDIECIPLTQIAIHPMLQVRRRWEPEKDTALHQLAESLEGPEGLIHPIVVAPCPDDAVFGSRPWTLVTGRRRLEAARRLEWPTIPARVLEPCDLSNMQDRLRLFAMAVRENTERRDLHPDDQREAIWQLKQLFEAVYPAAMTRGRRDEGAAPDATEPTPPAFAKWAAKATSIPEWKIYQHLRRAFLDAQSPAPTPVDQIASPPPSQMSSQAASPSRSPVEPAPVAERLHQTAAAGQHLTAALMELAAILTPDSRTGVPAKELGVMRDTLHALQEATMAILTVLLHWPLDDPQPPDSQ